MALVLWAKSAAGTNIPFFKSFGKAVKSWREIFQQTFVKKVHKTQPQLPRSDALHKDKYFQKLNQSTPSDSLSSRIFKSLISSATVKCLFRDKFKLFRRSLSLRGNQSLPLLSLVGITLGIDVESFMESHHQNAITGIKDSFEGYSWVPESLRKDPQCLDDLQINTEQSLARGCEGVVYEATVRADTTAGNTRDYDYDLAVKAVFNYGAESNASSIVAGLGREMVPLQSFPEVQTEDLIDEIPKTSAYLPPHPNIVEMPSMFIDNVLVTEEGLKNFPAALPHSSNPNLCFGRNKTLYLVMKKTTNNLRSYLADNPELPMATRCFLLAQLLEGVAHLTAHGVAHRDLKSDNLLVDLPNSTAWPRLEICDFGCCLAEDENTMTVPFPSLDLFRGGNDWLMAPEIRTAVPGPGKVLDFEKSDLWAVGAIAYEILGSDNPFYPSQEYPNRRLRNTTYVADELPPLPDEVPGPIKQLVSSLLARDPKERPAAGVAATVVQMVLLSRGKNGSKKMRKPQSSNSTKLRHVARRGHFGNHSLRPLTKEELLFQRIWTQSLALFCLLTLTKPSDRHSMELVNVFVFLSRLTYTEFRASLKFF